MGRIHHAAVIALVVVSLAAVCLAQDADYVSELKQPTGIPGNVGFGSTVALSPTGNTLAVGMPLAASNGKSATGSVGVYARTGSGWEFVINLAFTTAPAEARMGVSIVLTDTKLIAAAPEEAENTGAIYFFTLGTTSWAEEGKFAGAAKEEYFGSSLALNGDFLLVGVNGRTNFQGVVLVYTLSAGKWTASSTVLTISAASGALGTSLSMNSAIAVAGAPEELANSGSAYVWNWSTSMGFSTASQRLTTSSFVGMEARLGNTVVVVSNSLIVVSTFKDGIYLFTLDATTWKQSGVLPIPADTIAFGMSMSFSARYLIVGYVGKVMYYVVSGSTIDNTVKELKLKTVPSDGYGVSVTSSGNYIVIGESYSEEDASGKITIEAKSVHTFAFPDVPSKVIPAPLNNLNSQKLSGKVEFFKGMVVVPLPFCDTPELRSSCKGGSVKLLNKNPQGNWQDFGLISSPFSNDDNKFGNDTQIVGDYMYITTDDSTIPRIKRKSVVIVKWNESSKSVSRDSTISFMKPTQDYNMPVAGFEDVAFVSFPERDVFPLQSDNPILKAGSISEFRQNTVTKTWAARNSKFILTSPSPFAEEKFGFSISLLGKTRLAASNNPPTSSAQAVYIFELDATTDSWILKQTIPSNSRVGFGWKIRFLADQTLCVSAYGDSNGAGSLVIYSYSGTQYESPVVVTPNIRIPSERFGYSFANEGSQLVVGARPCDDKTPSCGVRGSTYLFSKDSSGKWNQQKRFVSDVTDGSDGYGHDVAISGTSILVASPLKVVDNRKGDVTILEI